MSTFSQKSRFQTFALDSISFLLTVLCLHLGYREVFAHLSKQNGPNVSTFRETLDPSINLSLQWTVNKDDNSIIFSVEANTRQIIIGLTNRGQVNGSDLIVCGVDGSGAPYVFVSLHLHLHTEICVRFLNFDIGSQLIFLIIFLPERICMEQITIAWLWTNVEIGVFLAEARPLIIFRFKFKENLTRVMSKTVQLAYDYKNLKNIYILAAI